MPYPNVALYRSRAGEAAVTERYDAILARWPVPFERVFLPTRFGATHVISCGLREGPPLVLLHGWGGNAAGWASDVVSVAATHRVYAIDTIGQSGRSAPVRPPIRGTAYAEWLTDVLDALALHSAAFIGVSGGGWLTLRLGTYDPTRIARAVLLSTPGLAPMAIPGPRAALVAGLVTFLPSRRTARAFVRLVSGPSAPLDESWIEEIELLFRHYRFERLRFPAFTDEELRRFIAPTLVLMGAHEIFVSAGASVDRARALLPRLATARIIADAGHTLRDGQVGVLSPGVLQFLADSTSRQSPSRELGATDRRNDRSQPPRRE